MKTRNELIEFLADECGHDRETLFDMAYRELCRLAMVETVESED